jgi:lipoprotein-anchoring transpeptidase ErfK/SrfK
MKFKKKNLYPILMVLMFSAITIFQPVYSETKPAAKAAAKPKKQEFDVLKPGTMVNKTYKVKEDDNYKIIAKKYNLDYKKLMEINNVETPYTTTGHTIILTKETEPGNTYDGIIVNIPEQKLYFFYKGKLSKIYKVSVGKPEDKWHTPTGNFKIMAKDKAPIWHIPVSIQKEMKFPKTTVAAGPDNPLGNWWMGITSGIGIHSTNAPASIGYSVTHGCIRMNPQSAAELFNLVKVNTPVKIIYQPIKLDIDGKNLVYLEVYKNVYDKKLNTVSIVRTLLKKYKIKETDINWKTVGAVALAKKGAPVLISKKALPVG